MNDSENGNKNTSCSNDQDLFLCYNKGCGKTVLKSENIGNVCQYHPDAPVFHDAYKIWSCCQKKSSDFTEFLNISGCTFGKHLLKKPKDVEPKKIPKSSLDKAPVLIPKSQIKTEINRLDYDTEMVAITKTVSTSLLKMMNEKSSNRNSNVEAEKSLIGKPCQNKGCKQVFSDKETILSEMCEFHPGSPVFHEGNKYWSCCRKMTTDFTTFLNQKGCTVGTHNWLAPVKSHADLKWDWHQTNKNVIISIYVKNYLPDNTVVVLNPIRLIATIKLEEHNDYQLKIELNKLVNVESSSVQMLSTKIEITLVKAGPEYWPKLEFDSAHSTKTNGHETGDKDANVDLCNKSRVDLSDL